MLSLVHISFVYSKNLNLTLSDFAYNYYHLLYKMIVYNFVQLYGNALQLDPTKVQ